VLGGFERLRQHDGDRLALIPDLVVMHGHADRGRRRNRRGAETRHLGVREHVCHPGDVPRSVGVNRAQAPGRDRRADQHPVEHALGEMVGRVPCRTGHLRGTVLARQRQPEPSGHGRTPAAIISARRAAPRAIASL
jgi:hypothetical protein